MGTNFYLHKDPCRVCKRSDEQIHIGKSSMGWVFSLAVHPWDGINSLADWEKQFKTGIIFDEYEREIPPEEMIKIITVRPEWKNTPLMRHEIDGFCIGHGKGTWDLCKGEFC